MGHNGMKAVIPLLLVLIVGGSACSQSVTPGPSTLPLSTEALPAAETDSGTILSSPIPGGIDVSIGPLSAVLPRGLAIGASGSEFPRAEGDDVAPWDVTPGHFQLILEGYALGDKFHQPQILVYPAPGYAELYPPAFESIRRLDNILFDPDGVNNQEPLPTVPFFNAAQVFASNIQAVEFQNGSGVRFLTEYAQYAAPVNNDELFYHFQGLTRDGLYYVIVILPITVPILSDSNDPAAMVPAGGVAYPDINDVNADWDGYYAAITTLLDATPPESFSPAISQLDLLIQSIHVTP